jgi:hypothetical protein
MIILKGTMEMPVEWAVFSKSKNDWTSEKG